MATKAARLNYAVDGKGPKVALVHGVGGVMQNWDGVVERLRDRFELLRYDLRGHGASEKRAGAYTLSDFVHDHVTLLDELGWDSAHLIGFSLGGIIAQSIAIEQPRRVGKLALISAIAGRTEAERAKAQERASALAKGGANTHLDWAVDRWFTREFQQSHAAVVEERKRQARAQDPACFAAAFRVLADYDLADELHRIAQPTLVMTGEHDEGSTPRMARLMAERIPAARLEILPGLKHSVLLEAPDLIASHLASFLSAATTQ
jgi:(E)-2-((N-methylformamido)methylene)succinate hydrolase